MSVHAVLEPALQKATEWINDVVRTGGYDEPADAWAVLRAVLTSVRDRITVDEAAQLAAQLPLIVRGAYYEGWDPSRTPLKLHRDEFLDLVRQRLPGREHIDPEKAVRAVLEVLAHHVTPGELDDVRGRMPRDLAELWPR